MFRSSRNQKLKQEEKGYILSLHSSGYSFKDIATIMGCNVSNL